MKDSQKTMTGATKITKVLPKETECFSWKNKVFYWEKQVVLVEKTIKAAKIEFFFTREKHEYLAKSILKTRNKNSCNNKCKS